MPGRGDAGWRSHEVRVAFLYRTSREAAAGSGRPGAGCGADIVCAQKKPDDRFFAVIRLLSTFGGLYECL